MAVRKTIFLVVLLIANHGVAQAAEEVNYYYTDLLGTPLVIANSEGLIIRRLDQAPYGKGVLDEEMGIGFTGHIVDGDTSLVYMQQRYYDPEIGRFLSRDPARAQPGDVATHGVYGYGSSNPFRFVDPDGRRVVLATEDKVMKRDFAQAVKYLNRGGVSGTIAKLERMSEVFYVAPATKPGEDEYHSDTKTIMWDSKSAMTTTDGGTQTAALGLWHEFEHAFGDATNTAESWELDGSLYDTPEEKRVIDLEGPVAKKLGEGARSDHRGTPFEAKCSTCKEPKDADEAR